MPQANGQAVCTDIIKHTEVIKGIHVMSGIKDAYVNEHVTVHTSSKWNELQRGGKCRILQIDPEEDCKIMKDLSLSPISLRSRRFLEKVIKTRRCSKVCLTTMSEDKIRDDRKLYKCTSHSNSTSHDCYYTH